MRHFIYKVLHFPVSAELDFCAIVYFGVIQRSKTVLRTCNPLDPCKALQSLDGCGVFLSLQSKGLDSFPDSHYYCSAYYVPMAFGRLVFVDQAEHREGSVPLTTARISSPAFVNLESLEYLRHGVDTIVITKSKRGVF